MTLTTTSSNQLIFIMNCSILCLVVRGSVRYDVKQVVRLSVDKLFLGTLVTRGNGKKLSRNCFSDRMWFLIYFSLKLAPSLKGLAHSPK